MRGWALIVLAGLLIMASLVGAQTSDSLEQTTWQWTPIDPGYSVGWFDCVWRNDTLYVATRERFGYYLKLFSYYDGNLDEVGAASRYDDSVLWKQGYYDYTLLQKDLDLLAANDTTILRYRLAAGDEDRFELSRFDARKFSRKARVEPVVGYPRDDGVYMVFRSGDYKSVLDIDNNPRFYGKYFLIEVDSLTATMPKTFGEGRRDCDNFHGVLIEDTLCAVYREREAGPWFAPNREHTEQTMFLKYAGGKWSEPTVVSIETQFPGIFSWPVGFYRTGGLFYLITVSVAEDKHLTQSLYLQSSSDGVEWSSPRLAHDGTQWIEAGAAHAGKLYMMVRDKEDGRLTRYLVFDGTEWTDHGVVFSSDEARFRFEEGPDKSLYLFFVVGDVDHRTIRLVRIE